MTPPTGLALISPRSWGQQLGRHLAAAVGVLRYGLLGTIEVGEAAVQVSMGPLKAVKLNMYLPQYQP